jgi:hypothetical protein
MSGLQELNRYNIAEPQSEQNAEPNTIASAATIVPSHKFTFVTGTVQVANITPPVAGYHVLTLCFTNGSPGALLTTGNIKSAYTPIQNRPFNVYYVPQENKYYVMSVT